MVGYTGTSIAPICKIPKSIMYHSVRLLVEISPILSPGLIPNFNSPLEILFP